MKWVLFIVSSCPPTMDHWTMHCVVQFLLSKDLLNENLNLGMFIALKKNVMYNLEKDNLNLGMLREHCIMGKI